MDDSDVKIKILRNTISIINGCNSHSATYQADSKGRINFGVFRSTLKFCIIDKDAIYLNLFKSSVSYSISSQIITLKN
jgi:heat shock protein HslJ